MAAESGGKGLYPLHLSCAQQTVWMKQETYMKLCSDLSGREVDSWETHSPEDNM